jgi:ABC-2 type transport system permease protein
MTRPFYWSLRRELWESRSLYVAPLAIAVFVFFGYVVSAIGLPDRRRVVLAGDESKRHSAIVVPYDVAAMMLIFTTWIVGAWYCMDALHGERRDRSILFWKSLPVSDTTTVLSKAAVPLLVLPAIIFVVILATQILMLLWTSVLLVMSGMSPASTFVYVNLFQETLILLYGLLVLALWHAPVYAWMLLLSAWARRATLLWLVLPPATIAIFERLAFGSSDFARWIQWRLIGGTALAFSFRRPMAQVDSLSDLTFLKFLAAPGLWLGLLFAGAFVAIAARVRRQRDPN